MMILGRELPGTPLVLVREEEALAVAATALAPEERAELAAFAHEKRRREWTVGRIAAKSAVARHLARSGAAAPLDHIIIASGADGAPRASMRAPSGEARSLELGLTLTHGHGLAAAWALAGGLPGADLERIRPRPVGTFRFYLDEHERAALLALDEPARDVAAIVLWALKEAAWKTLRPPRGVGIIDLEVAVPDLRAAEGEARVELRGGAVPLARERGASRVRAWFRREGEIVFAWAEAS